jgi:hypothetical protein
MQRYQGFPILLDDQGRRYYKPAKYPEIPLSANDIYIMSVFGDRVDQYSSDYYGNTDDYWIINVANGFLGDSLFIEPGTQVRIPQDTVTIKQNYNKLNGLS